MDDLDLVLYVVTGAGFAMWGLMKLYDRWHRRKYGCRPGMRP